MYDEITGTNNGYESKENDYSFSFNDRGLIKNESFNNVSKDYYYDSRGYLDSYEGVDSHSYDYSDSGIADFFSENLETFSRIIDNESNTTPKGMSFDELGRVKTLGSTRFIYGVDGNLAQAENEAGTARYIYDESDQRLASVYKDKVIFKYDDFSVLLEKDSLQVFNPIKVAGYTVGVLQNAKFEPQYSDLRGTIFGTDESAWGSPYGVRKSLLPNSEIMDFVNHGRDSLTGLIRFGKRDYSPELGSFTTPDPLFLEKPDNCIKSPVECNLYSYAGNDPLSYTDPRGTNRRRVTPPGQTRQGLINAANYRFYLNQIRQHQPSYSTIRNPGPVTRNEVNLLRTQYESLTRPQNLPFSAAPLHQVINQVRQFPGQSFQFGNNSIRLDRSGLKHILERHHPSFWNGSVKQKQSFFSRSMSVRDIQSAIRSVLTQNRGLLNNGNNRGKQQIHGTYNGTQYTLGLNNSRVGQFYPNQSASQGNSQ